MTYSLGTAGVSANTLFTATEPITLSDQQATPGGMEAAMQTGTAFLCKNPDLSQTYYVLDAERSTPSKPVLIAQKP